MILATLTGLESPGIVSLGSEVELILPSDQGTTPFALNANTGTTSCTYVIRDAAQGLCHATQILSMLVDVSNAAATEFDATPAFEDYVGWILDTVLGIHELLRRWRANPVLFQPCAKLDIMILSAAQTLMKSLWPSLSPSVLRKGYGILTIIYSGMLEDPTELPEPILQTAICSGLLHLAYMCQKHDSMSRTVTIHLLPALEKIFAEETILTKVGTDFRVSRNVLKP